MILDKNTIKKILDTIRKRHNLFAVRVLGQNILSDEELKELIKEYGENAVNQTTDLLRNTYYAGRMRNADHGTVDSTSFQQFENKEKPLLTELEEYSVEHAKEVTNAYIQKLSQNARTSVETLIRNYNKAYKDKLMTKVGVPMSALAQEQDKSVGELAQALKHLTGDFARDWTRVAVTEVSNMLNVGMADRIIKQNPEKSPKELLVFKRVVNDSHLCSVCKRLHLMPDGVTPRVYTMEEAIANGSNVGRKSDEALFTVGTVHPHCRCFVRKDVKIYTKTGWRKIGEIKPGEEVLTHKGRFRKVVRTLEKWEDVYKQELLDNLEKTDCVNKELKEKISFYIKRVDVSYTGKVYKIGFIVLTENGRKIQRYLTVTPEHRFLTKEGWKEAKDLKVGEKLSQLQKRCEYCEESFNVLTEVEKDDIRYCNRTKCHTKRTAEDQWKKQKTDKVFMTSFKEKQRKNNEERYKKYTKEQLRNLTKNGRKKCSELGKNYQPSKPQLELFELVKVIYPEAVLEYDFFETYSFDIAIPSLKLDIEFDGSPWHTQEKDEERDSFTRSKGWEVIRYRDVVPSLKEIEKDISRIFANHDGLYSFDFVSEINSIKIINDESCKENNRTQYQLYDLEVEEDHSFVSYGIVSHNCILSYLPEGYHFNEQGKMVYFGLKDAKERVEKEFKERNGEEE